MDKKGKPVKKHIAYLGGDEDKQLILERLGWSNGWELVTQSRRAYKDFKGNPQFKLVGRETRLLTFRWLSGRLFVQVNHEAAERRSTKNWERGIVIALIDSEELQLFIQNIFGLEIFNLYWHKIMDARRFRPEGYDWIEKMRQGGPFISLKEQADAAVVEIQGAIAAQEYLKAGFHADYVECLDSCITNARSKLERILTLERVHIYTLPEDLPNKLLNATGDICKKRMAKIAKDYKKWYDVK